MLQRRKRIAIHFNRESFHRWEQYSKKSRRELKFKRAWTQFQKIKKNGAIVVAQYARGKYIIGEVKKGSRLKFISSSKAKDFKGLKSLKLHNIRTVTQRQRQMITMFKPMQSTLNPIRRGADYVRYAYGLIRFTPSLKNMHYKVQEVMCAEWLRSKYCPRGYRIEYLLTKIGQGMEAVDILGQTITRKKLYAQVTYSKSKRKVIKKLNALVKYSGGDGINIIFSNADLPNQNHAVIHIPLQQVWDDLYEDKKYKHMIREMIGL